MVAPKFKHTEATKSRVEMVPGFEEASSKDILRLILSIEGIEKTGKTHFALTAPGPIGLIDMDIGLEGVIEKFAQTKKIYVARFNYRDATSPDEWQKMWDKMKQALMDSLISRSIRTVIVDTASEMWELARMAAFGKLLQVKSHHYAPVNAEFRDLITKAHNSDKNLILIHRQKKEYVNEQWTGRMERSGFGEVGGAMQANIVSWRITALDETYGKGREDEYRGFGITIRDSRKQPELAGTELLDLTEQGLPAMNNFPYLALQIFPSTDQSEWE